MLALRGIDGEDDRFRGRERDDFSSNFYLALFSYLSMISAQTRSAFVARENRYPLFRIRL